MVILIQPLEITNRRNEGMLAIVWSDGATDVITHRSLREACRCAHCSARLHRGNPVRAESGIRLTAVEPYGANTLQLGFDDGHRRGLYPFDYLRSLGSRRRSARNTQPRQHENELAKPSRKSGLR